MVQNVKKVHYMSFVLVGFHLETITLQFSTLTLCQTTPFLKEMKEALYHDENSYNIIFNVRNKRDRLSNDLWHQQKL